MALKRRRKTSRPIKQGTVGLGCDECGRYVEVDADTTKVICSYCVHKLVDAPTLPKTKPLPKTKTPAILPLAKQEVLPLVKKRKKQNAEVGPRRKDK